MRNLVAFVMLLALFLTACTQQPAPGDHKVSAPPVEAAPSATAQPPQSADALNDQALLAIRAHKWTEAVDAATQAMKLAPNSSAAYFNRGRAELGAGKLTEAERDLRQASMLTDGKNADVEYYLGQVLERHEPFRAAVVYQKALAGHPEDNELAKALADLKASHADLAPLSLAADINLDGKPEQIRIDILYVTVQASGGEMLYAGYPFRNIQPDYQPKDAIGLVPLPGEPPLIHLQASGCPSYTNHALLWYDPAKRAVRPVPVDAPCSILSTDGKGGIGAARRSGTDMEYRSWVWQGGALVPREAPKPTLMTEQLINPANLRETISRILAGELGFGEMLFSDQALYKEFEARAIQGKWAVGELADPKADPVRLPLLKDGKVRAHLLFAPTKHEVYAIEWLP